MTTKECHFFAVCLCLSWYLTIHKEAEGEDDHFSLNTLQISETLWDKKWSSVQKQTKKFKISLMSVISTAKRIRDISVVSSIEPKFDNDFCWFTCFVQDANMKLFLLYLHNWQDNFRFGTCTKHVNQGRGHQILAVSYHVIKQFIKKIILKNITFFCPMCKLYKLSIQWGNLQGDVR